MIISIENHVLDNVTSQNFLNSLFRGFYLFRKCAANFFFKLEVFKF